MNGFLVAGVVVSSLVALAWCARTIVAAAIGREGMRATLENPPDSIHLEPAGDGPWHGTKPDALAFAIAQLGFEDAGTWRVREMPVVMRLFAHAGEHLYACVHQHAGADCWFDFICVYDDGGSVIFTTAREADSRLPAERQVFHARAASPAQLYARALAERPNRLLAPVSAANAASRFVGMHAERVAWRKTSGAPAPGTPATSTRAA